ncbi:hypothetical protein PC120_g27246, partial [Phytophthora cactorum]
KHDCTIENVWWDDVCEDALSIKGGTASSVSTVTGGGARSADDKVIQHNGYGTVKIDGFYGEDISKLYRSCGTCGDRPKKVSVSNVYIVNPENAIVTVNKNWGDEATLSNIWVKSAGDKVKICQWSQGNADGEPSMLGDGPSPPLCQYSESDVHINGDVSQATGTSTSSSSTSTETQSSSTGSSATQTASTASSQESTGSVSTSAQIPTNSSTAASDSDAPGTVAPAGSNSNSEQTSVSTESSKTQQEETNEESNDETTQTQQSTISSNKNGDSDEAQNEEQTITSSSNDSTTSNASTSSTESSSADSTTQTSSAGSTTQASSTGATTQSSNAGSTAQTSTNSSSTSTSTGSVPDGTWPASTGTVLYTEPYTIKAGEVFDGKMQTFERSDITCSGGEGQKDTAVFLVEAGGTLKNAIIGKNQKEGVHCDDHDCTIENVWWDDVCEDALSIKGGTASSVTTVTNCGARYASDKVVQHNGYGTVKIDGFFAQEFGKLYRSCGTCG